MYCRSKYNSLRKYGSSDEANSETNTAMSWYHDTIISCHETMIPTSHDYSILGKLSWKKNGKKRGHCPLLATPPPKRVKRGHLLSDYRQKCVNGTRDSYCGVKSPFLSDLRLILTHIVVSKDSYWLILWCQKSISEWFETHIVVSTVHFWVIWESKGTMSPFFTVFLKWERP